MNLGRTRTSFVRSIEQSMKSRWKIDARKLKKNMKHGELKSCGTTDFLRKSYTFTRSTKSSNWSEQISQLLNIYAKSIHKSMKNDALNKSGKCHEQKLIRESQINETIEQITQYHENRRKSVPKPMINLCKTVARTSHAQNMDKRSKREPTMEPTSNYNW